jgi:hypothetical protein
LKATGFQRTARLGGTNTENIGYAKLVGTIVLSDDIQNTISHIVTVLLTFVARREQKEALRSATESVIAPLVAQKGVLR